MPLLLEACPSISERWQGPEMYEGEHLLYVDVGDFAHHLVELMQAGNTRECSTVFDVVERLHLEGDAYVKELATVGLLEGIQNVAGGSWRERTYRQKHSYPTCGGRPSGFGTT